MRPGTPLAIELKQRCCPSILIAEDHDDIRETLFEVLPMEGYTVHTAKNGKEALAKLGTIPSPTLVLLDLMMPVMSGWEFLDAQRANAVLKPHQVLVVSAVPATQSLECKTPLTTAGSLTKPLDLAVLLDRVRDFCGPGAEIEVDLETHTPGKMGHSLAI